MSVGIDTPANHTETALDTSGLGGHPKGLTTLFFTEMWERFSYYGMRAILILYMTAAVSDGGLGFPTTKAASIYGLYVGSVYFMSLPGGWVADHLLGGWLAVLVGGIIIACGHFSMAFPSLTTFYGGLVLIVLGTGLLKPNISTMVGGLYGENDQRRDSGFSLFYMGINLGAFIAPFVCGFLAQGPKFKAWLSQAGLRPENSWHWGFAAAGVCMVLGLTQYLVHRQRLARVGLKPPRRAAQSIKDAAPPLTGDEVRRLIVIGILFVFSTLFWMAFEQAGSSLNLFADKLTRNTIFGWAYPSSWLQSAGPAMVIIFAPVFSWLWLKLQGRHPSSPAKFAYGLLFASFGFLVITYASTLTSAGQVSPMWLMTVYLLLTFGELCLSPVGLSITTKLAPPRLAGLMMGVWFMSISLGNYTAGWVAGFFKAGDQGALVGLFGKVALITLVGGVILASLTPYIRKLMGKVH